MDKQDKAKQDQLKEDQVREDQLKHDNPKHDKPQHETPRHVILYRYNPKTAVSRASRRALGYTGHTQQVGELGAPAQFPEEGLGLEPMNFDRGERELNETGANETGFYGTGTGAIGAGAVGTRVTEADAASAATPSASAAARNKETKAKAEKDAKTPDDFLKSMTRYDALVIGRRDFDDHDKPVLNLAYFRHDDTASHHALNGVDWADTLERMLDVPHQSDMEQQAFFYLFEGEKLAPAKRPVNDDEDDKRKSTGPELVNDGSQADLSDMSKAERKEELGAMNKAELRGAAEQHGVQTDGSMNKGEITSALNKQLNKEAKTGTH